MLMSKHTIYDTFLEDGGATVLARVYGNAGTAITQASLTSITWAVYNADTEAEILAPAALTVSAVVFDTLQTGNPRWTKDGVGYNFVHALPVTAFPAAVAKTRIQYKFTPTSGAAFWLWAEGPVLEAFGG
jgi:hypothetical protein